MSNQIFEMVVDPRDDGTYFAANGTDVLRTTDSGAHWAPSDTGLPSSDCQSVAIDPASPDTVYAACGAQMSQSTDGGDSWSPFGPNLGPGGLRHVTVSPTDGGVIFADTSNTLKYVDNAHFTNVTVNGKPI